MARIKVEITNRKITENQDIDEHMPRKVGKFDVNFQKDFRTHHKTQILSINNYGDPDETPYGLIGELLIPPKHKGLITILKSFGLNEDDISYLDDAAYSYMINDDNTALSIFEKYFIFE